jgi:molecular chaperone DnaK
VLLPSARGSVRLHRSEFEGLIREQVEETVDALRKAVLSAGCAPEGLTAVLLVGGSSRIPLVAQLVSDGLGRPVAVDTDPKNAIAKGAALSVSPKPTASWPEVAIPLVRGAEQREPAVAKVPTPRSAGLAGIAAGMAASAGAGPIALSGDEARPVDGGRAESRPHEPARALLTAAPRRPAVHSSPAVEEGAPEEVAPSRRPVGLLVGIGGLVAVAAIVLAALLVPKLTTTSSPGIVTESGTSAATATTAPAAAPAPAPTDTAPGSGGGNVVSPNRVGTPPRARSTGGGPAVVPSSTPAAQIPVSPAPIAPTTVPVAPSATATVAPTSTESSPTTVAEGSAVTDEPGGATPVSTGSSGSAGSDGAPPVGTGSSGRGSSGGVTPVSTGSGSSGAVTPVGTVGRVTPVGTGSSAGVSSTVPTAAAPTVSA